MVLTFFIGLIIVMVIYAVMLVKFRQSRKRLEALQKVTSDECYSRSNITFHQTIGIFKKNFLSEVPGLSNEQIKTLEIKSIASDCNTRFTDKTFQQRKRRSSSVLKSLTVLVSHVRAAKYIFILLTTLIVTWTPFMVYCLYESIAHMVQNDLIPPTGDVNMTTILDCVNIAVQNKECNMAMEIGNEQEITDRIRNVFHFKEAVIVHEMLGFYLSFLNSLANPVLYAFWYPDFRNYLVNIAHWWNERKIFLKLSTFH